MADFPFKAVIFDMDGVLIDTEMLYWTQLRDFSEDLGLGVTVEELNRQVGFSQKYFQRLLASWLERIGRHVEPVEAEGVFNDWVAARGPNDYASLLNPGVHEAISALKARGVRVALASSSTSANIAEVLHAIGLDDAFEVVVSGEQFHESKPNPEIYLRALELLGLDARECCCVEDSVPGIKAGKAAGLTVFAKREERFGYSQAEADAILDGVIDLLDVTAPTA